MNGGKRYPKMTFNTDHHQGDFRPESDNRLTLQHMDSREKNNQKTTKRNQQGSTAAATDSEASTVLSKTARSCK